MGPYIFINIFMFSQSRLQYINWIFNFLLRSFTSIEKVKLASKVSIHVILLSLIFDIIWIIQYTSYWSHGEDTSDLWKSLSLIHNCAYYLGILEFLLKIPALLFLYKQFTTTLGGELKELLSLNYSK